MNKQLILRNLKTLHAAVEQQPEALFDLSAYKQELSCGTLFCSAGLAASMPVFQAQGMGMDRDGQRFVVTVYGVDILYAHGIDKLFGEEAWDNCFATGDEGYRDSDAPLGALKDKQLALWRLEKQMEAVLASGEGL